MKRVMSIQDISCFGKCSNTVALPVLSVMGVETVMLPTAVFSTHTLFKESVVVTLDESIEAMLLHWQKINVSFDCIYSGYLASREQIQVVQSAYNLFASPNLLKVVDPVMGDNGQLYSRFDQAFVNEMNKLCRLADIITPNLTEATQLASMAYTTDYTEDYLQAIIKKLRANGIAQVIITGVSLKNGYIGAYGCRLDGTFFYKETAMIAGHYHGTGDLFASCLVGGLMQEKPLEEAVQLAVDFVGESVRQTDSKLPKGYGVSFEKALPYLVTQNDKRML